MQTIIVYMQGSSAEPYRVTIQHDPGLFRAYCTCLAGVNGQFCKHRGSLMVGSMKNVCGGDVELVPSIPRLLSGTKVLEALNEVAAAEQEAARAKAKVVSAKKKLVSSMRE